MRLMTIEKKQKKIYSPKQIEKKMTETTRECVVASMLPNIEEHRDER